jgi:hypothetical protein
MLYAGSGWAHPPARPGGNKKAARFAGGFSGILAVFQLERDPSSASGFGK